MKAKTQAACAAWKKRRKGEKSLQSLTLLPEEKSKTIPKWERERS